MKSIVRQFKYGRHNVILETGIIARQATAAVMASMDDTTVLVTVVAASKAKKGQNFLPLTVNYQERSYAAGRIPGSFFRREGRPGEGEILISRLIDRPLRPLFPTGFYNEVQVVATVVSVNPQISPDIVAIIGASAALTLSGLPFYGPIGAARVGYLDGKYLLNPTQEELAQSHLDLVVAGTQHAVLMVESEADQLSEEEMLGAVLFGHQQQQVVIENINSLAREAGKPRLDWQPPAMDPRLEARAVELAEAPLSEAYHIGEKQARYQKIAEIKATVMASIKSEVSSLLEEGVDLDEDLLLKLLSNVERRIVRGAILRNRIRIDQRDPQTVRALAMSTGVLPRTHGSALFTRGETQALVVATLGTERDMQVLDEIIGERSERLLLHYNFPPYAVGEVGLIGTPKRREIGHGRLAKRALAALMPSAEEFPYTIRLVSEITESNGSSSMATVCGASLALMDAGVPIKAAVAGIAMGLIKEEENFVVLSDIMAYEDHLGDMDFKVAGTSTGITALQMDIKIEGIGEEIMRQALHQAKGARQHILSVMQKAISDPRSLLSEYAPQIHQIKINPERIRDIIGKGGSTIKGLVEETGAEIDVKDDGSVRIAARSIQAIEHAVSRIRQLTLELEKGELYLGTVTRIAEFGAFVSIAGSKEGLVHISQISDKRVEKVEDVLQIGQEVRVKVLEIDRQGRIRLSIREALEITIQTDDGVAPLKDMECRAAAIAG